MYTHCSDHKENKRACSTCNRIGVENDIVARVVDAMIAAGYALFVDGQGDDNRPAVPTTDRAVILAELQETDDDHLMVFTPEQVQAGPDRNGRYTCKGWVRFVYGNDGYDVISDYTTNLETVLAPITQYAESLG